MRSLTTAFDRFIGPKRRLRRSADPVAVEALERRILPAISYRYAFDGLHELEVVGRTSDGTWWATGFDLNTTNDDAVFDADTEVFAKWSHAVNWRHVTTGDYDGDGLDDIAGWDPSSGNWWNSLSDGVGSTTVLAGRFTNALSWSDVGVLDLPTTGDRGQQGHFTNKGDLVGRGSNGQWWAGISNGDGTFTNQLLTYWDPTAGWRDVQFVDVDADGETDIVGRTQTGQWWAAMNRGGLTFENVYLGAWNEAAGWRDVRSVYNFFGDNRETILGRTATGQWWTLRFTAGGQVIAPVGTWNESLGWQDVVAIDGTENVPGFGYRPGVLLGRTSNGEWYQLEWDLNTGTGKTTYANSWNESLGWRDVQAFQTEQPGPRGTRVGVIGRDATGVWQVGILVNGGIYSNRLSSWSTAGSWSDVAVADVTRAPVVSVTRQVASAGIGTTFEVVIYGNRRGTNVLVEDVNDAGTFRTKVTYTVAGGAAQVFLATPFYSDSDFRWDVSFYGHYGADVFTNPSTRPAPDDPGGADSGKAYGYAGGDTFDTTNGLFDALFGGDGVDTLVGDPGDAVTQDG